MNNIEANKVSKESLKVALITLMGREELHNISITDLVKRAGVSRATFYRNYNTKEDVIDEIIDDILSLAKEALTKFNIKDNPYEWYLYVFKTIKENKELAKALVNSKSLANFSASNNSLINKINMPSNAEDYYKNIVSEGAYLFIVKEWVVRGMIETPDEMARICVDIMPKDTPAFRIIKKEQ